MKQLQLIPTTTCVALSTLLLFSCMTSSKKSNTASHVFKNNAAENKYHQAYDKSLSLFTVKLEARDIQTTYGTAHVLISGPEEGEVVVLLHGMDASSTMWYPNMNVLSEKYRVYAIDFINEPGRSIAAKPLGTHADIIKWYDEVFSSLQIEEFHLIGMSRGGWLSVLIARHTKRKIRSLLLLSPAQTFQMIKPKKNIVKSFLFILSPQKKRFHVMLNEMSSSPEKIDEAWKDQLFLAVSSKRKQTDVIKMAPYTDEELQVLQMPVMVIIGDRDAINESSTIERAKKVLPHAKTETLSNCGHFLNMDQREILNQELIGFLKSVK